MTRAILVLSLLLLIVAACRPPDDGQVNLSGTVTTASGAFVSLRLLGEPFVGAVPVQVTVELNGAPVTGARVRIFGDMTHAGMTPVVREATEVEPGTYRASDFAFTMAGDWVVTAEVALPGGDQATAARAVSVPR